MKLDNKLKIYYTGTILSVFFAAIGFSYNAWRLESTEDNNNIRMASFTVLNELAELEQIIFAARYDQDTVQGNPRKGWVKVGLIVDLSHLINDSVRHRAETLKQSWTDNWQSFSSDEEMTDELVRDIEGVRSTLKSTLLQLD